MPCGRLRSERAAGLHHQFSRLHCRGGHCCRRSSARPGPALRAPARLSHVDTTNSSAPLVDQSLRVVQAPMSALASRRLEAIRLPPAISAHLAVLGRASEKGGKRSFAARHRGGGVAPKPDLLLPRTLCRRAPIRVIVPPARSLPFCRSTSAEAVPSGASSKVICASTTR